MSKIGQKFLLMFLLLVAAASVLLLSRLAIGVFFPQVYALPFAWLPEDMWMALLYQFLLELGNYLPALSLSAVLLTFSFWLRPADLPGGSAKGIPASQALVRFSVLAIACAGVFSLLVLFAQPWLQSRTESLAFREKQARELESAYLELKTAGLTYDNALDLEARLALIQRLGTLRPTQNAYAGSEQLDYDFELQIIKTHIDMEEFFHLRLLPGVERAFQESMATVEELLTLSEQKLAQEAQDSEFQANLLAYSAFRRLMNAVDRRQSIDQAQLKKAQDLIDESWTRIRERTLLSDERLKASYFFRKGKSLGDYNFQNYLEAYYGFQELHIEDPSDAEVARYWTLSLENLRTSVLFRQEMDVLFKVPGSEHLVFLNRTSPREVIRIGKLLDTSQGVYVKDFEFFRFSDRGEPLLHWRAPYGRWTSQGIDFRVWEKDQPQPNFPQILLESVGNPYDPAHSDAAGVSDQTLDPPLFLPSLTVRDLQVISATEPAPQTLGTWQLLTQGRSIEALGYTPLPLQTEFVGRLLAPFAYFVLFLFVFALAWHFRAHETGKSWWLLFPLLPLVTEFFLELVAWSGRLALGGLVAVFSLSTVAIITGVSLFVASVVGLVLAYGQLSRSSSNG